MREFDPTGIRTIGVVTNPDQINAQDLATKFLKLVRNKDEKNCMPLGWHGLRNPGPGEVWDTPEVREIKENKFFAAAPWNQLGKEQTRAASLTLRPSTLLTGHIEKHVPAIRDAVQKSLDEREAELKMLGDGTDSDEELQYNISDLFSQSSTVTSSTSNGTYNNPRGDVVFFTEDDSEDDLRVPVENLRAVVNKANEEFSSNLLTNGHSRSLASDSCDFIKVSEDMRRKKQEYAGGRVVKEIRDNVSK